jgi:hypothetical protein
MKPIYTIIILFTFFQCSAQNYRISHDTLFVNDSVRYIKGQYLYLKQGTETGGHFNYIFTNPASLAGYMKIGPGYANTHLKIKDFEERGNKKMGHKVYLKIAGGNLVNYWCDVASALIANEVEPNSRETQ